MAVTAKEVNKLRQMTGAGMMDCKKALTESDGDFDAAVDYLRKKGQKVSASRSDKEASEGVVFVKSTDDLSKAVMITLNCETDFVAKNDDFQKLGHDIVEVAFEKLPADVEALMQLKIGDLSIKEKISEIIGIIGEKIEVGAYESLSGELVVPYVHAGSKLGVMVALKGVKEKSDEVIEAAKDVAMQIAAMNPVGIDENSVDPEVVEREKKVIMDQTAAEGKPEHMVEKIADGRMKKFFKENTLLNQSFVKNSDVTVSEHLKSIQDGLTVAEFKRITVGS